MIKIYRVWRIFGNKTLTKLKITDRDMIKPLGFMLLCDIMALVVWSTTSNASVTEDRTETHGLVIKRTFCSYDSPALWFVLLLKVRYCVRIVPLVANVF